MGTDILSSLKDRSFLAHISVKNMMTFATYPDSGVLEYFKYLGPIGGWTFVAVVVNSFLDFGIAINNSLTRMLYGKVGGLGEAVKRLQGGDTRTSPKSLLITLLAY